MSGTFTDAHGRIVTVTTAGGHDTYAVAGVSVAVPEGTPAASALSTLAAMAPWAPLAETATLIDPLAFIGRLTQAEQAAIMGVRPLWGLQLARMPIVDVTDPTLVADIGAAVAAGLLTQARAAQVLDLAQASP
jgi:hypothetical protein